ncbi:related to Ubiquitin carboxyl-terminal hydrolase 4 [Melanopsichium pennsylvanicum]|uniref:ubiquitinyl hydrolase 1 n=2 Tax=Melanopsichium pennsylvanicum TaxID=63383 RepID=A0AAJ4XS35_9BASI|nr:related to Ubiquitin carboxyl-terminal hydrolase 4 [Melanopsichium pennsylvanicum 4]SNX87490.1 related to Ubiquitin carboxyl-terminal hydrolase 4 [Melanopsichium pennsylvanicum]
MPAVVGTVMSPSSTSSAFLSANHPLNLRKQAQPKLDSNFGVKTYIGAANALLDKARAADAQDQIEVAFVNYLKAASVAAFISKHDDWPTIQKARGSVYQAYNELMKQAPAFIDRTKRLEMQLAIREERNAKAQAQAAEEQAQNAARQREAQPPGDSALRTHTSTSPAPFDSTAIPAMDASSHDSDDDHSAHGTDAEPVDHHATGRRTGSSLADRLQALRNSAASDPAELRNRRRSDSTNSTSALPRTSDLTSHLEALSEHPPSSSNRAFDMHSFNQALPDASSAQPDFPAVPTASEFSSAYPTIDQLESWHPPDRPISNDAADFPAIPTHSVGKVKRPLPAPPTSSSTDVACEFALARDVPEPFSQSAAPAQPAQPSQPPQRKVDGLPNHDSRRFSLQQHRSRYPSSSTVPTLEQQQTQASTSMRNSASASGEPFNAAHPASLMVGSKPALPMSNHISEEDLFNYLNPGFEKFTDAEGKHKIGKKLGLNVLLLDVRSRAEYEAGRILGGKTVCIEPITLREGMSSADIEDKLVLSPPEEQGAFATRNSFDLVVLYDRNLRSLRGSYSDDDIPQDPTAQARMDILIRAIYENEFSKTLSHQPVLLIGGFERWAQKAGEKLILRSNAPNGSGHAQRSSISFEPGTRFPTADDPSLRGAAAEQAREQELKRSRRQQQVLADGSSPSLSYSMPGSPSGPPRSGMQPGGVYPSRTANGTSSPFAAGSTNGGFSTPSLPARAYQSAGIASGAPSFPPAAAHRPPSRSNSSTTFDYPQLKPSSVSDSVSPYGMAAPQPPPMAASSTTPSAATSSPRDRLHSYSTSTSTSLTPGSGSAGGNDPSKKQVMAPGYAGHLSTQSSRMYASPTNGRSADEIKIGLTGLKNLGNSCYMNSTLQCLSATIPLARFLLDGSYKQAINRTNPLGTQGQLATALAGLVHVMWGEKYAFVSPVTFREAMARFAPSFRGYDQHDSQEFLAILLDGLHEDLNYVVTRPAAIEMTPEREHELETLPQQIASVKEWSIYRMRNDSLIVDWFQGQFRNKLTCLTCGKTSTTYEAYTYLSLPVPHGRGVGKVTLQQCLDAFVREEILDKGDMWNCPRCKKPRRATKRLSISRLPQILLIHLKRFSFKGPFTDKIDTTVTFPTNTWLDLTNYMPPPLPPSASGIGGGGLPVSQSQKPPYLYDLYAVTHHFGSLNTGHYTATVKSNREFWYLDDSRVVKGDYRQLHTNSPYVLWFRRKPN